MNKSLVTFIIVIFCTCISYAQDSFFNPYSFAYEIEYSTEYIDSITLPTATKIEVQYDVESKTSTCTISYNGEQKYQGRVLDMQLDQSKQTFVLEKYFYKKYNACLLVVKEPEENSDLKVAMIYYANMKEDSASGKTCYCLLLKDIEKDVKP